MSETTLQIFSIYGSFQIHIDILLDIFLWHVENTHPFSTCFACFHVLWLQRIQKNPNIEQIHQIKRFVRPPFISR